MKVADLKVQLKARGEKVTGNKAALIVRLSEIKDKQQTRARDTRHYCGCLNTEHGLVTWLRNANMKLLIEGGRRRDPQWYQRKLRQLFVCLTTNEHDGTCMHIIYIYILYMYLPRLTLAAPFTGCAHHDAGYSVPEKLLVTCPFHRAALRQYFDILYENAEKLIDPILGRVHNNFLESGFAHVWAACPKRTRMSSSYFKLMASIGLLHSNQTAMRKVTFSFTHTHVILIREPLTHIRAHR